MPPGLCKEGGGGEADLSISKRPSDSSRVLDEQQPVVRIGSRTVAGFLWLIRLLSGCRVLSSK